MVTGHESQAGVIDGKDGDERMIRWMCGVSLRERQMMMVRWMSGVPLKERQR